MLGFTKAQISGSQRLATSIKGTHKGKNSGGMTESTPKPLVTKKAVHVRGGKNKESIETRVSESQFVNQYHQLPEEPLLKWILRVPNLGTGILTCSAAEQKGLF